MHRIGWLVMIGLAMSGCRSARTWGDLSAPRVWQELEDSSFEVASDEWALPIVTDDVPANRRAAIFLARTIGEMTGHRPTVTVERKGWKHDGRTGLFVGQVAANAGWACERSEPEAFRIIASGGAVRFLGRADYAVFDWCERELGLRYYASCGKCVEKRGRIVARAVDYSDWPVFAYRWPGTDAEPWLKVSKVGVAHRGGVDVHQPHGWYTNVALKAEQPDIFETGETPMLCYGNPQTLAYYQRRIDRHIAGLEDSGGIVDTRRKVVTVCQWDAPIKCTCPHCRPFYDESLGKGGEASPIIWGRFLKPLASWLRRTHPDYEISFLPYLNTCEPARGLKGRAGRKWRRGRPGRPSRQGLDDWGNSEAEVCVMPGLSLLKNPACREKEERILRDWQSVTGRKVLGWQYGCWPRDRTEAPYVFGRTIRDHYAQMRDVTCGSFVCGGVDDVRLALSMYVWMRCLWNPDVDVEAIYDGFARRMFGPAAVPMRQLIALQEEGWNRPWPDDVCSYRNVFGTSYPRQTVERMEALLSQAEKLATEAGDATATERVRWYAGGLAEFLAESKALAARQGRRKIRPGESCEMVSARRARVPQPWVKTTVETSVEGEGLLLTVRCDEPAASRMDFSKPVDDYILGNDSVTFAFVGDDGDVLSARVDLAGGVSGGWSGFSAAVSHDQTGWTVRARIPLTEKMRRAGSVLGNISRWRVGDRRLPEAERVPGSRLDHMRLETCYTQRDDDPAAFVEFRLGWRSAESTSRTGKPFAETIQR